MGRRRATEASTSTLSPKKSKRHEEISKRTKQLGRDQDGRRYLCDENEFRSRSNNLKSDEVTKSARLLKTTQVEQHLTDNRKDHHTNDYELEKLIVRRGQAFKLTLEFNDDVDTDNDKICLQFVIGNKPQQSKGTVIRIPVGLTADATTESRPPVDWTCRTDAVGDKCLTVSVMPPPEAVIGVYMLFVETKSTDISEDESSMGRHEVDEEIYILFNAWCQEDTVYMAEDTHRNEYVLNDQGRIWMGSKDKHRGKPWNFGQFDDPCLEAALTLLDKAELAVSGRSSAVSVIRTIAALTNSSDEDGGVLTGRWTKTYPTTCTVPWAWNGSVAILSKFMETGNAVEFGQCWVFSGIVTTLLRTLGIPTRSVTNFASAHDTDCSMTIDMHWDPEGEPIKWRDDSIWNFHVWNESWIRRPDLPAGYDGWQAHDATPQESSEGVMRCGPASLKAIKEGQVYFNYDVPFIFAEVNGDRVHWMVFKEDSDEMGVIDIEEGVVGHFISTKAIGCPDREDVTHHYKYPEGSKDERRVVEYVNKFSSRKKIYNCCDKKDVTFTLEIPENPMIGEDFTITLKAKNSGTEARKATVSISTMASFYTGVISTRIKSQKTEETLEPEEVRDIVLKVTNEDYEGLLNCEASIQVYAQCRVAETKESAVKQASFFLNKPSTITIEMPKKGEYKEEVTATITFKNTLTVKLTDGIFHIEGSGLTKPQTIRQKRGINPGDEVTHEISLLPSRYGERELVVDFSSNQLTGVEGSATMYIPYPE